MNQQRDSDSESEQQPRANSPNDYRARRGDFQAGKASDGVNEIDEARLDSRSARQRFGEASLRKRDASKGKSSRTLPSTSEYSTRGISDGEKETTLERLRRLRSEVEDLEDDVKREAILKQAEDDQNMEGSGSGSSKGKGKKREVSAVVFLQQLQMLRGDLGNVEGMVVHSVTATGEAEGLQVSGSEDASIATEKPKASSSLLSKLGFGSPASASRTVDAQSSIQSSSIGIPTSQSQVMGLQLEKRLAEIERVVGANEADVNESSPVPTPLLQTLTRLDHLLTLLTQPRHLDSISRRVKVLVSDLERLHESRRKLGDSRPLNVALSGGLTVAVAGTGADKGFGGLGASTMGPSSGKGAELPADSLQKVDVLFSLLHRLEPLLPLTPRLLSRLQSLASLHSSAADFDTKLQSLSSELQKLGDGEKGLREVVSGLEGSLKENNEKVKGNLEVLEKRILHLSERLYKLNT